MRGRGGGREESLLAITLIRPAVCFEDRRSSCNLLKTCTRYACDGMTKVTVFFFSFVIITRVSLLTSDSSDYLSYRALLHFFRFFVVV